MRIINLHAENYKRLGVVEIAPDGNLITIGGKNGHGKTSVLDAIYVALKGRAVAPPQPIRKGQEKCTIRLDLGEMVITRNFHQKEGMNFTDTLKVESADGLIYKRPQDTLSALLGEVGFDPFEFVNKKPKDQAAQLLEMVPLPIDLDEFAELDHSDVAKRRDVNREVKRLEAQIEGIAPEDVPEEAPDREALTDTLSSAAETNASIEREKVRREGHRESIAEGRQAVADDLEQVAKLRREADELEAAAEANKIDIDAAEKEANELPDLDEPVDTEVIREKLRSADAVLAAIDRQDRRKALMTELEDARAESEEFTKAINQRARERNEALAGAEMPVEGLAFAVDEEGGATLTYEGLPFDKDQISTAVQLRVSTAIGMAANPQLRVLRIADGSLLDEDSMKLLAEMADAEDFQLWVEVVGDGGTGIIMENGLIRGSAEQAEALEAADEEAADQDQVDEKVSQEPETAAEPEPKEKVVRPAGRQYLTAKFSPDDERAYTYHNDGEPLAPGERVRVPTKGEGSRTVTVHAIDIETPTFETKGVIGLSPAEDEQAAAKADDGKLI